MTIEPIKDNQTAFTLAAEHLIRQGKRAKSHPSYCAYRDNGRSCAVGIMIPDELYDAKFESKNVQALVSDFDTMKALFANVDLKLLVALQYIHDDIPVEIWPQRLSLQAKRRGLELPSLVKAKLEEAGAGR